MKKGIAINYLFIILLGVAIFVALLAISINLIGKTKNVTESAGSVAQNQLEDPCFKAKLWLNTNPNKACEILCSNFNKYCNYPKKNAKCDGCKDFCIKCNCITKKYLGSC